MNEPQLEQSLNNAPGSQTSGQQLDAWLETILQVAGHYRLECSRETIRVSSAWNQDKPLALGVRHMARQAGLGMRLLEPALNKITPWRLPLVAQLRNGQIAVVTAMSADGFSLAYSGDQGLVSHIDAPTLQRELVSLVVFRPLQSAQDVRVDEYIKPFEDNWLRRIVLQDLRPYRHIMVAALVVNLLSLAGIFFSRQVYDRVVPAQSYPTLYVLFGGVLLALLFSFLMRKARTRITDVMGKRADIRISDLVFGHALRVKNAARPKATGTFISQLRELEHVRDMMTSTTVSAISDLPFFLLFSVIFWYIAPPLAWIPFAALLLLIVPSLLAQPKLRKLAKLSMRESSLRNAMLVESVQGMEDIKLLQAEQRFQNQWNHYNAANAESGLKLRDLTQTLSTWTQTVQGGAFAVVVFFGAPLVMEGSLTTGSLVAASILSSRMISPLASVTQLMNRWQQAKVAHDSLNRIMQLPVDTPENEKKLQRPVIHGNYDIQDAAFSYDDQTIALQIKTLQIQAGERIVVLGRNGTGKSTLLQVLAGLMEPRSGVVLLDGGNLSHIDPADVRRDVGLVSQNARLFHGTLRENLLLGAPSATDADIEDALRQTGAWTFVQQLPAGLDHVVMEGGLGLSGGQRQSLLLSRMLIRQPNVLLLDEPTASLDDAAEKQLIQTLESIGQGKVLVIATHRLSVVKLADRLLVMDRGRIAMDGPRDQILEKLRGNKKKSDAGSAKTQASAT